MHRARNVKDHIQFLLEDMLTVNVPDTPVFGHHFLIHLQIQLPGKFLDLTYHISVPHSQLVIEQTDYKLENNWEKYRSPVK